MLDTAQLLVDVINKYSKADVVKRIRDKYKDYEGDGLIDEIYNELQALSVK